MASIDRITSLRKFYPPASAVQTCTLDDAIENRKSRSSTAFPSIGLLATRGLVWEATGEPCKEDHSVPPGRWCCVACVSKKDCPFVPKKGTSYGFGQATQHWREVHHQQVHQYQLFAC